MGVDIAFANHDSPFAACPIAQRAALSNRLKNYRARCIRVVGWATYFRYELGS